MLGNLDFSMGWLILAAVMAILLLAAVVIVWYRMGFAKNGGAVGSDLAAWQRNSRNWANSRTLSHNVMAEKMFLEHGCADSLFLGWHNGKAVVSTKYASLLIVASTGSGKTSRLIVPNIIAHRAGPVVSTTVKADVMELTRAARQANGSTIRYFDPLGVYGVPSIRFSPLCYVHKFSDAQAIATVLLNGSKSLSDNQLQNQAFWDSHGRQVLAPLLLVAVQMRMSMCDVRQLLAQPNVVRRELQRIGDKSAITAWDLHTRQPNDTRGNVESTVGQVLEVWEQEALRPVLDVGDLIWLGDDPRGIDAGLQTQAPELMAEWAPPKTLQVWRADDATWANRQPDLSAGDVEETIRLPQVQSARLLGDVFDLDAFLNSNDTLYLLATQETQEAYAPLFEVLISMILAGLERHCAANQGRPLKPGILFAIDEAANVAPLRKLDVIVTKVRGEGGLFITVWQSKAQIDGIYGQYKANVIWDNHLNKVFLGGISDRETIEYIIHMVGRDMYPEVSVTKTENGTSRSTSMRERDVVDTHFYNSVLKGDEAVLEVRFPDSKMAPAIVNVPPWFNDNRIRRLIPSDVAERFDEAFGDGAKKKRRTP